MRIKQWRSRCSGWRNLMLCGGLAGLLLPLALQAAAPQRGQFKVMPPRVESAALRAQAREWHASGTLQEIAKALNEIFLLPRDVALLFAECGESNAYYDSDAQEILMCLELLDGMSETLDGQFETEEETSDALAGAFIAVALHEVGHALVHLLELPITGREEDAADQLAAWMLIEADDVDSVLGAAASYYNEDDLDPDDLSDEHSLDKQRYFNMVCWAYGSDPDNSQALIDDWELPEARAEGCADEYALLDRSWTRLLSGHVREGHNEVDSPVASLPSSDATIAAPPAPPIRRPPQSPPTIGSIVDVDDQADEDDDEDSDSSVGHSATYQPPRKRKGSEQP